MTIVSRARVSPGSGRGQEHLADDFSGSRLASPAPREPLRAANPKFDRRETLAAPRTGLHYLRKIKAHRSDVCEVTSSQAPGIFDVNTIQKLTLLNRPDHRRLTSPIWKSWTGGVLFLLALALTPMWVGFAGWLSYELALVLTG
jgi:hypothetical protein